MVIKIVIQVKDVDWSADLMSLIQFEKRASFTKGPLFIFYVVRSGSAVGAYFPGGRTNRGSTVFLDLFLSKRCLFKH